MIASALTACAALPASAPTSSPAPTVTVTSTPAPAPTPVSPESSTEDDVSALDAWLVCYGATHSEYSETFTLLPYSEDQVTENGDGTFEARVLFAPTSGDGFGAESICIVGGTVGEPIVEIRGARDFG